MKIETRIDANYIESILEKYDFKKVRKNANGFTCLCPFHDNHNTPAFSISNTGLWMCWSCGVKGGLKALIERLGGKLDWKEELKILGAQVNPDRYAAKAKKPVGIMPFGFKPYSIQNKPPAYLFSRVNWETTANFRLGSGEWCWHKDKKTGEPRKFNLRDRIIIPIIFKDKPVGFHARSTDPNTMLKYYNSEGFEIKDYLFNYDGVEKGKELIVVEGAFNAMSMWQKGFRNVVATFGTKFTPKQIQLMFSLAPESIVICFDRDSNPLRPGQKAAIKLAEMTYQLVNTYIMPLPLDRDPNDLSEAELIKCHSKKVAYEKLRG